jgi:hypothetical protein
MVLLFSHQFPGAKILLTVLSLLTTSLFAVNHVRICTCVCSISVFRDERLNSIHFQYTLLLGNFLFLYCNESVLFYLILNIQSRRFEFVKKFDAARL